MKSLALKILIFAALPLLSAQPACAEDQSLSSTIGRSVRDALIDHAVKAAIDALLDGPNKSDATVAKVQYLKDQMIAEELEYMETCNHVTAIATCLALKDNGQLGIVVLDKSGVKSGDNNPNDMLVVGPLLPRLRLMIDIKLRLSEQRVHNMKWAGAPAVMLRRMALLKTGFTKLERLVSYIEKRQAGSITIEERRSLNAQLNILSSGEPEKFME